MVDISNRSLDSSCRLKHKKTWRSNLNHGFRGEAGVHLTTFWFSRNHPFLGKFYGGTDRGPLNGSTKLVVRPFAQSLALDSSFVRSIVSSFLGPHSFGRPFFHSQVVILWFFRLYVSGLISFFSLVVCSFIVLRFVRLFHYWCSFFIRSSIDFFWDGCCLFSQKVHLLKQDAILIVGL